MKGPDTTISLAGDVRDKHLEDSVLLHIAENRLHQLSDICCMYAATGLCEEFAKHEPEPYTEGHERWEKVLDDFYTSYCRAFSSPALIEDKGGLQLKQELDKVFQMYNDRVDTDDSIKIIGGGGLITLCWNEKKQRFKYPTHKRMMKYPWSCISRVNLLKTLKKTWEMYHLNPNPDPVDSKSSSSN
jgi:hypothetical protein